MPVSSDPDEKTALVVFALSAPCAGSVAPVSGSPLALGY